jgi:hypothetical protein
MMFGTLLAAGMDGVSGATDTVTDGIVIVTAKDFVASITEVAVIVTEASLAGGVAGPL